MFTAQFNNCFLRKCPRTEQHGFPDVKGSCVHMCKVASVVSNSVGPYGLQTARLLYPWVSPGNNTGVGCHALLQRNLQDPGTEPTSTVSCMAGGFFTTETLGKTKTPIGNPIPTSYKEQSISGGFKCCHSVITTALRTQWAGVCNMSIC